MSVRSLVARRAPAVLRSLQRARVVPSPGQTRRIGERPEDAPYGEHGVNVYRPAQPLTPPQLRPQGPLGDECARLMREAGERHDAGWRYGVLDVPRVRIWPSFGVHATRAGNFVDVYCGSDALSNPKYEFARVALPALPLAGRHEAGIFITPAWYHNFYHWTVDLLPRLDLVGAELAEGLPVVVPAHLSEGRRRTLRRALEVVGAGRAPLLELAGGAHQFERLVMPTQPSMSLDITPGQRAFLRRLVEPRPSSAGRRRIYVSRRDAAIRRIANEDEIEGILATRGFATVVLSQLSPAEQAGLFQEAEAVVGHHGAGFANAAFCAPGTLLVEIFQEGHFAPCFARLAQLGELRYGFGVGRPAAGGDTWLDPDQLTGLLDRAGL